MLVDQSANIAAIQCFFTCKLLPVDMKWLVKYAGELGNSASLHQTKVLDFIANTLKTQQEFVPPLGKLEKAELVATTSMP